MTETGNQPKGAGAPSRTPTHLWLVGVLALMWNSVGAFDYLASRLELEFYMSQLNEEQLAYFTGFPKWMISAWALAVWCSVAGSVGLLLRRSWAVPMFGISLAGLAITSFYNFVLSDGAEIMGTGGVIFSIVIWIVSILLLAYAMKMAKRGVLR